MADEDDDLKATVETITAEAERLTDVEREKATLEADDPRTADLPPKPNGSRSGSCP